MSKQLALCGNIVCKMVDSIFVLPCATFELNLSKLCLLSHISVGIIHRNVNPYRHEMFCNCSVQETSNELTV